MSMQTSQKKKAADPNLKDCANCGTNGAKLTCTKCKATHYCSKACQKHHWKNSHKTLCVTPEERRPHMAASAADTIDRRAAGRAGAGGNSVECPICLESFSEGSLCTLPCEHEFHRDCVEELRKQGVQQVCPLCRTLLPPGPEQLFEDASRLFVSTAGRHRAMGASWKPRTAAEKGDIAQVVDMWTKSAKQGHISAAVNLGTMYRAGKGVAQDYNKAVQYHRQAADQGFPDAQFTLGLMYHDGEGVAQDLTEAMQWYHKAADQGVARAQCCLAAMYYFGMGVTQDLKQALFFILAAEAQGVVEEAQDLRVMVEADLRLTSSECPGLDAPSARKCTCCGRDADNIVKVKPCPRCKGPLYCGKDCQSIHWKNGHKERCKKKEKFEVLLRQSEILK